MNKPCYLCVVVRIRFVFIDDSVMRRDHPVCFSGRRQDDDQSFGFIDMLYLRFNMPDPNLVGKRPMLLQVASSLNEAPSLWQVQKRRR
jgi:hypothetical protein